MTLEKFAKKCGVLIVSCEPDWGGRIAYKTSEDATVTICGFRSKAEAYRHWLRGEFSSKAGEIVLAMLKIKTRSVASGKQGDSK